MIEKIKNSDIINSREVLYEFLLSKLSVGYLESLICLDYDRTYTGYTGYTYTPFTLYLNKINENMAVFQHIVDKVNFSKYKPDFWTVFFDKVPKKNFLQQFEYLKSKSSVPVPDNISICSERVQLDALLKRFPYLYLKETSPFNKCVYDILYLDPAVWGRAVGRTTTIQYRLLRATTRVRQLTQIYKKRNIKSWR